jgi:tRNA(fMet)-specific endonuclease VapC
VKKILVDTNAYSALMAGDNSVLDVMGRADIVFLSSVVCGELFDGFKGGSKEKENRLIFEKFIEQPQVHILPVTIETSEVYACVRNALRKAGTPIPLNDVWIASHSLETGSTVITFDAHFSVVPGLRVWGGTL